VIFDPHAFVAAAVQFREQEELYESYGLEILRDMISFTLDEFEINTTVRFEMKEGIWAERTYKLRTPYRELKHQVESDQKYLKKAFNTVKAMIKTGVKI